MIPANVKMIRERIARCCERIGRDPVEVTLVAVAKTFPAETVREVVQAGVGDIGENYVQELQHKRDVLGDKGIRWHFVGHLQSNKARMVAPFAHLIHAVDSVALARELDRRVREAGRVQDVLIEVNTTGEGSKFGVRPDGAASLVRSMRPFPNLRIAGLMTIGPFLPDPEGSRPMFRLLRELRDSIAAVPQDNVTMRHLSMGMTGDFEVAIEEGATIIRIGTAIFGHRVRPPRERDQS
jgi:pyridoxal phosphate enzyme (YggS family)